MLTKSIELRIIPEWFEAQPNKVVLKIEIENKCIRRIKKNAILLQVLEYPLQKYKDFSDWIPFSQDELKIGEVYISCVVCETRRFTRRSVVKWENLYCYLFCVLLVLLFIYNLHPRPMVFVIQTSV